jgi:glutamine synthetase
MPFENDLPFFLGELADEPRRSARAACLRRMLDKRRGHGLQPVSAAFEFEFFMFDETPHSVREKNYRNLTSLTPGFFGYSMLRNSVFGFVYELLETMQALDCEIEGLHTETGPGVLEAAIAVDDGLAAADKATLFKTFTKMIAQRNGLMATFMAKWSNAWPGQSPATCTCRCWTRPRARRVFHDPKPA